MSKKQGQKDESSETKPMSEDIILNDQVQMLPLLKYLLLVRLLHNPRLSEI